METKIFNTWPFNTVLHKAGCKTSYGSGRLLVGPDTKDLPEKLRPPNNRVWGCKVHDLCQDRAQRQPHISTVMNLGNKWCKSFRPAEYNILQDSATLRWLQLSSYPHLNIYVSTNWLRKRIKHASILPGFFPQ